MALQVLGSRIDLVAAGMIADEPPRRPLSAGALIPRSCGACACAGAGCRARASRRRRRRRRRQDTRVRGLWRLHPAHIFIAGPRRWKAECMGVESCAVQVCLSCTVPCRRLSVCSRSEPQLNSAVRIGHLIFPTWTAVCRWNTRGAAQAQTGSFSVPRGRAGEDSIPRFERYPG